MSNHLICFLGRNGSGKTYQSNKLFKKGYTKISLADPVRELAWKTLGCRPKDDKEYIAFKSAEINNKQRSRPYLKEDFQSFLKRNPNFQEEVDKFNTLGLDLQNKNYNWQKINDNLKNKLSKTSLLLGIKEPLVINVTGRQYLQNLAEGCKEMFGNDFWVKAWEKRILDVQYIILGMFKIPLGAESKEEMEAARKRGNLSIIKVDCETVIKQKIVTDDIRFPIEVETAHKLGAKFVWCDYKQGDYESSNHVSEALANKILASGKFKDGDEISYEELQIFIN